MSVEAPKLSPRDQIQDAISTLENLKIPAILDSETEADFRQILLTLSDLQTKLFSLLDRGKLENQGYYRLDDLLKNLNSTYSLPFVMVKVRTALQYRKSLPTNDERAIALIANTIQEAGTSLIEAIRMLKEIASYAK